MRVISFAPPPPLRDSVYWLACYDDFLATDLGFRMISEGTVDILIPLEGQAAITVGESGEPAVQITEPALIGPQRRYSIYDTSRCSRALGIVFTPGGAARFFGPQIGDLTDAIIPARDAFGPAFPVLCDRLRNEPDPQRLFDIVVEFLKKRLQPELAYTAEMNYAISAIRRGETRNRSLVDFAENTIGFSHKHFVELFWRYAGLTPRRYQQIVHFNGMLAQSRLAPQATWQQLATVFGYVDVSHLAKDFRRLAGITPGEYHRTPWSHRQVVPLLPIPEKNTQQ